MFTDLYTTGGNDRYNTKDMKNREKWPNDRYNITRSKNCPVLVTPL